MIAPADQMGHEQPPRRGSRRLWVLAALAAVLLHGGCIAFAMTQAAVEDVDDANGAPAIEIGMDWEAPRAEPTDLPPGPEAEASAAAPAVVEQKAVAEQSDLPKDMPTETEDPDRLVTTETVQKPKEEEPTPAAQRAVQSNEAVASEATAPPSSEMATTTERSVAPVLGNGDSARKIVMAWQKQLVAHLDRHKRYPSNGSRKAVEITVGFTLDRTGHVLASSVVKSSGDAAFDEAALTMLKRADPVPAPPPLIADEGLSFTVPVIFRVKGRG